MKRLSLIIVTYESEQDIYDCLDSVWSHCDIQKDELEVIVVDNSPHCEPMFDKLKKLYGNDIVLIHNTHNGGYGQGNNLGIKKATAPVILIMNPDVRLLEPVFSKVLHAYEKDHRLSLYGMKQMLTPTIPSKNSFACTYMMNGYLFTLLTAVCNRLDIYLPKHMYISGSCFFIRKEMFEGIGLFDESIFMYGEEDDIHYRLLKKYGSDMVYDKHLHYIHLVKDREPDIVYEKRAFSSVLTLLKKKGQPKEVIILNKKRNINLQLWREKLSKAMGKGNPKLYKLLIDYRNYLNSL